MARLRALATRLDEAQTSTPSQESSGVERGGPEREASGVSDGTPKAPARLFGEATPAPSLAASPAESAEASSAAISGGGEDDAVDPDARTEPAHPRPALGSYEDEITASMVPAHIIAEASEATQGPTSLASDEIVTRSDDSETALEDEGPSSPAEVSPGESPALDTPDYEDAATVVVRRAGPSVQDGAVQSPGGFGAPADQVRPEDLAVGGEALEKSDSRPNAPGDREPEDGEEAWFRAPEDTDLLAPGMLDEVASPGESSAVRFLFGLLVVLVIGAVLVLVRPWISGALFPSRAAAPEHTEQAEPGRTAGSAQAGTARRTSQPGVQASRETPGQAPAGPMVGTQPDVADAVPSPSGTKALEEAPVAHSLSATPKVREQVKAGRRTQPPAATRVPPATDKAARASPSDQQGARATRLPGEALRRKPQSTASTVAVRPVGAGGTSRMDNGSQAAAGAKRGKEPEIGSAPIAQGGHPGETGKAVASTRGEKAEKQALDAGLVEPPAGRGDVSDAGEPRSSDAGQEAGTVAERTGTLVFRVIPGDSAVRLGGRDMRDACWDGCSVAAGKHVVEVVHPDGRTRSFTLTVPAGQTRRCLYRFGLSEPLQCR